jgi:hypothetical protein
MMTAPTLSAYQFARVDHGRNGRSGRVAYVCAACGFIEVGLKVASSSPDPVIELTRDAAEKHNARSIAKLAKE